MAGFDLRIVLHSCVMSWSMFLLLVEWRSCLAMALHGSTKELHDSDTLLVKGKLFVALTCFSSTLYAALNNIQKFGVAHLCASLVVAASVAGMFQWDLPLLSCDHSIVFALLGVVSAMAPVERILGLCGNVVRVGGSCCLGLSLWLFLTVVLRPLWLFLYALVWFTLWLTLCPAVMVWFTY